MNCVLENALNLQHKTISLATNDNTKLFDTAIQIIAVLQNSMSALTTRKQLLDSNCKQVISTISATSVRDNGKTLVTQWRSQRIDHQLPFCSISICWLSSSLHEPVPEDSLNKSSCTLEKRDQVVDNYIEQSWPNTRAGLTSQSWPHNASGHIDLMLPARQEDNIITGSGHILPMSEVFNMWTEIVKKNLLFNSFNITWLVDPHVL